METIYIGFSRPKGGFQPFSWIIRLVQRTPYSHVYVRCHSDSIDRDIIYQASKLMVNFICNDRFKNDEVIVKEFPIEVSQEAKIKMLQFSVDNAGASYGILEVLGIFWVILNSWFGRKVKNPLADGDRSFVCSEFVGDILKRDLGANLPDPETIGPKQIYQYLQEKN